MGSYFAAPKVLLPPHCAALGMRQNIIISTSQKPEETVDAHYWIIIGYIGYHPLFLSLSKACSG